MLKRASYICLGLLLVSSVNFSGESSFALLITRILPVSLSILISVFTLLLIVSSERKSYIKSALFSPFVLFYSLFVIVNIFASIIHGIALEWILWKNIELIAGIFLYVLLFVYSKDGRDNAFIGMADMVLAFTLFLCIYELWLLTRSYDLYKLVYVIRPYLSLPKINPIRLSIFGAFIFLYGNFRFTNLALRFSVRVFALFILLVAKSRTGILIILLHYLITTRFNLKVLGNWLIIILFIGLGGSLWFIKDYQLLLRLFRIDSLELIMSGGGRLASDPSVSSGSSWGESIVLIKENILVGIGNINAKRFLVNKIYSVDNFILQCLLAGGIIGGLLVSIWAFLIFPIASLNISKGKLKSLSNIKLLRLFLILFWVPSLTTNGAAFLGMEFLFLALAHIMYMQIIKPLN